MRSIFIGLAILILCGCTSAPKINKLNAASLVVRSFDGPRFDEVLSAEDVATDLSVLKYALAKGYVANLYPTIHSPNLEPIYDLKVKAPISVADFADAIGNALWTLPDGHLSVRDPKGGTISSRRIKEERQPSVGTNILEDACHHDKRTYAFRIVHRDRKMIPVLSICDALPAPDDPLWSGFDGIIKKIMSERFIVVDLRGVRGGSDMRGMQLANALIGSDVPDARGLIQEVRGRSPECLTLLRNQILENQNRYSSKGETVPASWLNRQRETEDALMRAAQANAPSYEINKIASFDPSESAKPAFKGHVYILIDAKCGSSCESTLEYLLWHPNVVTAGENTRGMIHFTETGLLILPKSQIAINVPTKYNDYHEFIEKLGHKPTYQVPSGSDAFDWLIKNKL